MDWVERLIHLSPDGGNGTLEVAVAAGAALAVAMIAASAGLARLASRWRQTARRPHAIARQPVERGGG
ncbi:MAG TPA: hypothetical protein VGX75_10415 [bacterium]|nr:hypothetical protein [bacterium]